ncbi:hypothetical protein N431DRAFT_344475 [Stipitochalara longipes BDJ]|nr:hypothetical protein N431DRAFT_344475 [Stipitochalara longipes BDJ]
MATFASSSRGPPTIDMTLLNDLYEEIENRPPALEARRLLIQQCMEAGWVDAARDAISGLLALDPYDEEAHGWADILSAESTQSQTQNVPTPLISRPPPPSVPDDIEAAQRELVHGYEALRIRAAKLLRENYLKEDAISTRFDMHIQNLTDITDGRISSVVRVRQPGSAQSIARAMEKNPERAVDIAIGDLEDMARWLRSQPGHLDNDAVREALVKRVGMVSSALSDGMKRHASLALMHVEHELLHRTYVCDETMYGDKVADIPRARFLTTEDGYPWDMEELAQAIQSGSGIMRNPLSRQMFTTEDIRMILQHPLGKGLAALGVEQGKLSKGVRPKTIEELEKMSVVLLADMSEDQMASRHVLDHFLGYVATLPESEQKALNKLRVPAKDSHTGQAFDTTIGEAVRDAKANVVCIHKIGDFLQQAARHLKKSR